MTFFNRLLGRKNRTQKWTESNKNLLFDFQSFELCGVPLGAPIGDLSFLGPDEKPYLRGSLMDYSKRGVQIREHRDIFHQLTLFLLSDSKGYDRFLGDFQMQGQALNIDSRTTPEQLKEYFWRWSHTLDRDEQTGELYEFNLTSGNRIIETMWEEDGQLLWLDMSLEEQQDPC